MKLCLLSLIISLTLANEIPSYTTAVFNSRTKMVLFGTRHGNRNPEKFVNVSGRSWGLEGEMELTNIGKRQALGLGKELRKYLGDFVNRNYIPSEAKFYSSSANRCQMTLQCATTGIYDPSYWADWDPSYDHWSPVPYTINDQMLRMYSIKGCIKSDEAWKPISDDTLPDLAALMKKHAPLLNYMKQMDGRDATIGNAADIADNYINMDFHSANYPDWLENPTLKGYDKQSIREAFLFFAENHMNRCASYKPCRDMMGGIWAGAVVADMENAAGGNKSPKLVGYASHTEVTLATMILLGIDKEELTTSAGFVAELRDDGKCRLLQHEPNPIDDHVIFPANLVPELARQADSEGWMKLSVLKSYVSKASFSMDNWEEKCGIVKCPKPARGRR